MTTTVLVPNAVAASSGTITPTGGTSVAVLTDASDATYDSIDGTLVLDMTTVAMPAGAVILNNVIAWRGSGLFDAAARVYINGDTIDYRYDGVGLTIVDYALSTPILSTQAWLDAFQVVLIGSNGGSGAPKFYSLSVSVTYALVPTTTAIGPTGAVTTTTLPTVTWSHTPGSSAQTGQTAYQVRIFTAAQYGIGGFDPAVSPSTYDSGIIYGSVTSLVASPLANSTTYRAYVRTAQTSAGQLQWAAYAYPGSNFNIAVTTSDITSVGVTVDNTNARNTVLITRNGATPTWTNFDLQRSVDGGATWQYVRGGYNTAVSGSTVTVQDYETANTQTVTYRARASYTAGSVITGAWVSSSSSAGWTSTSLWLKDPFVPARNLVVENELLPEPVYPRTQGVFPILGSTYPVVVSDVMAGGRGSITLETYDAAGETAIKLLLSGAVLLLQAPTATGFGWGSRYVAPGDVAEIRKSQTFSTAWRQWQVALTEVAAPAVT